MFQLGGMSHVSSSNDGPRRGGVADRMRGVQPASLVMVEGVGELPPPPAREDVRLPRVSLCSSEAVRLGRQSENAGIDVLDQHLARDQ